jgi:hypothetical protein
VLGHPVVLEDPITDKMTNQKPFKECHVGLENAEARERMTRYIRLGMDGL